MQALVLSAQVRAVTAHGVRHGAAAALAAAHLCLLPRVDLHTVVPGFLSRAEVLENIDVGRLIADFGAIAKLVLRL